MVNRRGEHATVAHHGGGGAGPTVIRIVVIIICGAAIVAMIQGSRGLTTTAEFEPVSPTPTASAVPTATSVSDASSPTTAPADVEVAENPTVAPTVPHVGIVAGHWGYDTGASCPDGLTEVEVNRQVAELVVQSLRGLGYQVELLQEYDDRLPGYLADALVSIHADSCQRIPDATPPPTGFKVASVVDSLVPEEERRLVRCLTDAYAERTGLPIHENSITGHMTGYHTFYDIDGQTPGAIIETGFMWLDRDLLMQHPDVVAQGIVDGIICFVEGE